MNRIEHVMNTIERMTVNVFLVVGLFIILSINLFANTFVPLSVKV